MTILAGYFSEKVGVGGAADYPCASTCPLICKLSTNANFQYGVFCPSEYYAIFLSFVINGGSEFISFSSRSCEYLQSTKNNNRKFFVKFVTHIMHFEEDELQ